MILPIARLASGVAAIATTAASATHGVAMGRVLQARTTIANAVVPPLLGNGLTTTTTTTTSAVAAAVAALSTAARSTAALSTPALSSASTNMAPASVSASASLAFVRSLRGGGALSLDLKREVFFTEGMATYATVSALMMNAALMMCTSTKFAEDQSKVVVNTFRWASVLCILTGAFTAILFQLVTLYSKSALSMVHNDEGFLAFKAATAAFRVWGFRCFLSETMSLVVTFLVKLYNALWDDARIKRTTSSGPNNESNSSSTSTSTSKLLSIPTSTLLPVGNLVMGGSIVFAVAGSLMIRSIVRMAAVHIYNAT